MGVFVDRYAIVGLSDDLDFQKEKVDVIAVLEEVRK